MLLSIVTGTYNRLPQLVNMMTSARQRIPQGWTHEFIVVDGGSTDGTLEYLRKAKNVKLIEHGALLGAQRAFTEGAELATGRYVVLANDDIVFRGNSLVAAVTHLERYPTIGAIAFQNNLDITPNKDKRGYGVQHMRAHRVLDDGSTEHTAVTYAQVGMYRRELGAAAGWWGWRDDAFNQHRQHYGLDNYLSAKIWEMGYSVASLPGVYNHDVKLDDPLAKHNITRDLGIGYSPYNALYPSGPKLPDKLKRWPDREQLRVLYYPVYEPQVKARWHLKRGMREALERRGIVWQVNYLNEPYDLVRQVRDFKPHLLLMQCMAYDCMDAQQLIEARRVHPGMVVVNWNGDVYRKHLLHPEMLKFLTHVDLMLTINSPAIAEYARHGIRADYWQIAAEPVDEYPAMPTHDILFVGNGYSPQRHALVAALGDISQAEGWDFGLYGQGWSKTRDANGETNYNFPASAALARNAKVVIGDNQFPDDQAFVSNRWFETLAHGAFLLHQRVRGLDELLGYVEGEHYEAWSDLADLRDKLAYWLDGRRAVRRDTIAQAGQAHTLAHHTYDHRVNELFTLIEKHLC